MDKKRRYQIDSYIWYVEVILQRLIFTCAVVLCILFFYPKNGETHWFETHEYMIDCACNSYLHDGRGEYVGFLYTTDNDNGRIYLDLLKQGVYDADQRVNGIYSVDKHCSYIALNSECDDSDKVANDVPEIIVGNHRYIIKPSKTGQTTQQAIDRVKNNFWQSWVKPDDIAGQKLLAVLKGKTDEQKLNYLSNYSA